MLVERSYNKI